MPGAGRALGAGAKGPHQDWVYLLLSPNIPFLSFLSPRNESIRTGFVLSQGGEFAFVLLSLANSLRILPTNLNQLLIIVVRTG